MRSLAVSAAVVVFFGLAIVGAVSDVPPFVCGLRALGGAAVAFAVVTVAGRAVISMVVGVILGGMGRRALRKDQAGEHAD